MSNLSHVVTGEPFAPAAADWNAFVDTARTVRDARLISQPGPLQSIPDVTAEGRMLTTLYPAVEGLRCATKATFVRWLPDDMSSSPYKLKEEVDDSNTPIATDIVNRDTGLTIAADKYVIANWINGEWRPVYSGHAVASVGTPCCSCGEGAYFTLPAFTITCSGSTNNVLTAQLRTNPICSDYFPEAPCVDCEYYYQGSAMSPTYGLDTHLIADLIESPKGTWTLSITYSGLCGGVATVITATYTATSALYTCPTLTMTRSTVSAGTWPATLTLTPG